MKVFPISKKFVEDNPYILDINKYKKSKDYIFAAMQILSYSFRDMAEVCGYYGDEEFKVFIRRLTKGHRMHTKSPKFDGMRSCIENQLRRKVRDEMDKEQLELAKRKKDRNRDSGTNSK